MFRFVFSTGARALARARPTVGGGLSVVLILAAQWLISGAEAQTSQPESSQSWVSEIVVTGKRIGDAVPDAASATRTDTPLNEIPQSVQVINRTLMDEQDTRTLSDALVNVSGVVPTKQEEVLFISPMIRGFPAEVYVDGLPIFGGNQQAFDPTSTVGLERIEVLKGPTSTMYGGGLGSPLGGLINLVSERPADALSGLVAVRAGSFSTWSPYVDVNVPLTSGIAARVSAEYQSNKSWIDLVEGERWSVKPSLLFTIDSATELLLQGQINRRQQLEYSGLPAAQALAGQLDRGAFPGAPVGQPDTKIDNELGTAAFRHAFNDELRLTISGRYYSSKVPEFGTFVYPALYPPDATTPTTYPILPLNMLTTTDEVAFDANVGGKLAVLGGRHELLAGFGYDRTRFTSGMAFYGTSVGDIDLARPAYDLAFGVPMPLNLTQTDQYQTLAGYVQDQATYGPLHVTGSVRYTQLTFREKEETTDASYNHFSPRIGATLDLAPGVVLYAGYATTFRAPFGFVGLATPKPEKSDNYEAGVKLASASSGLSGTFAVFQQTHDNVATPIPDNLFFSEQTGRQRSRGVEGDLIWEPLPVLSLIANYSYTDARVTADTSIPVGDRLPRVPLNSGRIAARYRVKGGAADGLSFGAGVSLLSSRQLTLPNSVSVPGYAAIDAQASYDFDRFSIEVSGVNLAARRAFDAYQYLGFPVVLPNQPRSVYVTLKARL
jgi:iron complex outermembrane receptor protein